MKALWLPTIFLVSILGCVALAVWWLQSDSTDVPSEKSSGPALETVQPEALATPAAVREEVQQEDPDSHSITEPESPEKLKGSDSPWRIRGQVVNDLGQPCSYATVRASWQPGKLRPQTCNADEEGRFEFQISEPIDDTAGIQLEAVAPAHQINWHLLPAPPWDPPVAEVTMTLQRRVYLRGTVFRPDGQPAGNAFVYLQEQDELSERRQGNFGRSDQDGKFQVGDEKSGVFVVSGLLDGVGIAQIRDLALDPGVLPEPVELWLQGDGVLAGHVRLLDGSPAPGLEVHTLIEGESPRVPESLWASPPLELRDRQGLDRGRTQTDERGSFRLSGLHPGQYRVQVADDEVSAQVVQTNDEALELITGQFQIDLRVVEQNGSPAYYARVQVRRQGQRPDSISLDDEGIATLKVPPQSIWWVSAHRYGLMPVERQITISGTKQRTLVTLTLPPQEQYGTLDLLITNPEGKPSQTSSWSLALPGTHLVLAGFGTLALNRKDSLSEIPPGSYIVQVRDEKDPFLLPAEKRVEIHAGKTSRAEVRLSRGGKCQLIVHTLETPSPSWHLQLDVQVEHPDFSSPQGLIAHGHSVDESSNQIILRDEVRHPALVRYLISGDGLEPQTVDVQLLPGEEVVRDVHLRAASAQPSGGKP